MEAIRKQLMAGKSIDKKAYKFAVEAELHRLFYQLLFLTFMSFLVATMLFFSLYFDIKKQNDLYYNTDSTTST